MGRSNRRGNYRLYSYSNSVHNYAAVTALDEVVTWESLLSANVTLALPWTGSDSVHSCDRSWKILPPLPPEHGWYEFEITGGRTAAAKSLALPPFGFEDEYDQVKGYVIGDRFIPDGVRVVADPSRLVSQTVPLHLVDSSLSMLTRAVAVITRDGKLVFAKQDFPCESDAVVVQAYEDKLSTISHIKHVPPALDLAFRFLTHQRNLKLERERKYVEGEKRRELLKSSSSAIGRREIAKHDFDAAAKAALQVAGAEFLSANEEYRGHMAVRYRYRNRRFECVVNRHTLRIVDAGICLTDHDTDEKYDDRFTLETIPLVVGEAIDKGVLVVWRRI